MYDSYFFPNDTDIFPHRHHQKICQMWHSMFSSSGTEFLIRHIFFLLSHDLPFLVMHLTYLYPTYLRFWDAFPCRRVLIWPSPTLRSGLSYIQLLLQIRRTRPAFGISQKVDQLLHICIKALSLVPNRRFPQPFPVSVFFILHQSFMATLFVIISIFTEANLATVPYYSYVPSHSPCLLSAKQTWQPFRTLRTIHAIRPTYSHLDDPFFPHFLHWPLLCSKRQISLTDIYIAALATANCH